MSEPQTPKPESSDEYFNSSRLKVIGLITAGVVLVGAIGGLAGVVLDPDRVETGDKVEPGSDSSGLGGAGNRAGHFKMRGLVRGGGESPTPVGSVTPGSETASPTESISPTDSATPTESASPAPAPSPDDTGTVTLGNGVQIFIPPGWQVDYQDEFQTNFSDGKGNWAYAWSSNGVPTTMDAANLISENLDGLLPPDNYTNRRYSEIGAIQPFGSVVSAAYMDYEALWVDSQGSVSLHGQIYSGIRQDGAGLIVLVEHAPAEDWDNGFEQVKDIVNATFSRFGGL
jgi:hypothetical protein